MAFVKKLIIPLFLVINVSSLLISIGVFVYTPSVKAAEFDGRIEITLDPSIDDATVIAERDDPDDNFSSEDNFEARYEDGVYVIDGIDFQAACSGVAGNPPTGWWIFNISAGSNYSSATVEFSFQDCVNRELNKEVTLHGADDDTAGTVTIGLNYPNCLADDGLLPAPPRARPRIEGIEDGDPGVVDGNYRIWTFNDVDPGEYRWVSDFTDSEGDGQADDIYIYNGEGTFTVTERGGRVRATLHGMPGSPLTPETDECTVGNLPPAVEEPEVEEVEGKYEQCMANFDFPGNWFVCFIIRFIDDRADDWVSKVDELLSVGGDEYNTDELKKAWSYFRNIASLLLMVIGIVMVIGQGISKE